MLCIRVHAVLKKKVDFLSWYKHKPKCIPYVGSYVTGQNKPHFSDFHLDFLSSNHALLSIHLIMTHHPEWNMNCSELAGLICSEAELPGLNLDMFLKQFHIIFVVQKARDQS